MQGVLRRLTISGMHVHMAVEDEDLRTDLLDHLSCIPPHLLALGTSSPFRRGGDAGLKPYRIAVRDVLPRTELPEPLDSYGEEP